MMLPCLMHSLLIRRHARSLGAALPHYLRKSLAINCWQYRKFSGKKTICPQSCRPRCMTACWRVGASQLVNLNGDFYLVVCCSPVMLYLTSIWQQKLNRSLNWTRQQVGGRLHTQQYNGHVSLDC